MVKLDSGNVLLKPSHRKQLLGWLRRSSRLGERLGNFDLTVRLARVGHHHEARAMVRDSAGDFTCRCRQRELRSVMRDLVHNVVYRLRHQRGGHATAR
jgi:hypothetical protein